MKYFIHIILFFSLSQFAWADELQHSLGSSTLESGKVVLPWLEVKQLLEQIETLKKATEKEEEIPEAPTPVDYTISQAQFDGKVQDNRVKFDAEFTLQIFKKDWITLPFFNEEVGIESLSIQLQHDAEQHTAFTAQPSKNTSTQLVRTDKGYSLLAKGPIQLKLNTVFYAPLQVEELTHTLAFTPPPAVINQVRLKIPAKGVNLLQKTAHSQVSQKDEGMLISTVLSASESLLLQWKIDKNTGISRKSLASSQALVSVDKNEIRVSNNIELKYLPTLENLAFHLPKDVEILNVESLGIERWDTKIEKNHQWIKLVGVIDAKKTLKIDFSYRLQLQNLPLETQIPRLKIMGVDNIEGFVAVEALGNLEVNAQQFKQGNFVPAKNLPKSLWQKAENPLLYGYQFQNNRFQAALSIRSYEEIQTIVANVDRIEGVTHRTLEGKSITRLLLFIRNNDRQFLSLKLPQQSRLWQVFIDGKPVKPAQKDSGEILIPMKKSASPNDTLGDALESFALEIGYITEVNKLTLKGDILNQLPAVDIPVSYLRWDLYLPAYYEYSKFEGPLKQVKQFSTPLATTKTQIEIPTQGQHFMFEKYLLVDEKPYVRGQYGQFLGDDIFLSLHPSTSYDVYNNFSVTESAAPRRSKTRQQVIPNRAIQSR